MRMPQVEAGVGHSLRMGNTPTSAQGGVAHPGAQLESRGPQDLRSAAHELPARHGASVHPASLCTPPWGVKKGKRFSQEDRSWVQLLFRVRTEKWRLSSSGQALMQGEDTWGLGRWGSGRAASRGRKGPGRGPRLLDSSLRPARWGDLTHLAQTPPHWGGERWIFPDVPVLPLEAQALIAGLCPPRPAQACRGLRRHWVRPGPWVPAWPQCPAAAPPRLCGGGCPSWPGCPATPCSG